MLHFYSGLLRKKYRPNEFLACFEMASATAFPLAERRQGTKKWWLHLFALSLSLIWYSCYRYDNFTWGAFCLFLALSASFIIAIIYNLSRMSAAAKWFTSNIISVTLCCAQTFYISESYWYAWNCSYKLFSFKSVSHTSLCC